MCDYIQVKKSANLLSNSIENKTECLNLNYAFTKSDLAKLVLT